MVLPPRTQRRVQSPLQPPPVSCPSLVIAVLVDNFQMALLKGLEKEKQEVVRGWSGWTHWEDMGRGHRSRREGWRVLWDRRTWGSGRMEASSLQKAAELHEKLLDDSVTKLMEAGTSTPLLP